MELTKVFRERRVNYFAYFSSRRDILHGDVYHRNELYFCTENVSHLISYLVIYVISRQLYANFDSGFLFLL